MIQVFLLHRRSSIPDRHCYICDLSPSPSLSFPPFLSLPLSVILPPSLPPFAFVLLVRVDTQQ